MEYRELGKTGLKVSVNKALLDEVLEILKPIENTTWTRGLPENN